jgi:LysM repeat protein
MHFPGARPPHEPAERRSLRSEKIFVQFLGKPLLCVYDPVMSGAPKAARSRALPMHMQAAFPVSAISAGRSPLGSPANIPAKRLLPIAAVPVAIAGLAAAAFTLGNSPGGASAVADASAHHPAATAVTPHAAATLASATQAVSLTQQPATGLPVVRLDATRLAAIEPKGKHHRTVAATYVIKPGDTLASIAQHHYHSSDYWPVLYWANHGKIKYANEISAGQVLTLPAKPAKIPGAPKVLAPTPPPSLAPAQAWAPAPTTSTASYGQGYSSASPTQAAPAQPQSTGTYSGSSGSFQSCVIAAESGGNSQVMNSSGHYGLYQFAAGTWAAYGGNPASFGNASVAEQNQVFDNAIAAGGQSNWAPYDGC